MASAIEVARIAPQGPRTMRRRGHAYGVAGRAARERQVEHHEHKAECRKDGDKRNGAAEQDTPDSLERRVPAASRQRVARRTSGRAQVAVWNMHFPCSRKRQHNPNIAAASVRPRTSTEITVVSGSANCEHNERRIFAEALQSRATPALLGRNDLRPQLCSRVPGPQARIHGGH